MNMTKVFALYLLVLYGSVINAQSGISPVKIGTDQVPKTIKFRGKLVEAWKWKDNLGENLLLLSAIDIVWNTNEDEQMIQLFAYQYCKKDTGYQMLWKLNDIVQQCPIDIVAEFIKEATSITDLDKDGIAETTVLYKLACRGDVSPADMKLIMHEDSIKYALRGSMWSPYVTEDPEKAVLPVTEKDVNLETLPGYKGTEVEYFKEYGRYKSEKEFSKAPATFLNFARRQWLRYVKESFD
jgi:hypothetical protein